MRYITQIRLYTVIASLTALWLMTLYLNKVEEVKKLKKEIEHHKNHVDTIYIVNPQK